MRIQVLGTGCAKCRELEARTKKAVTAAGLDAEVEKVEDIMEIVKFRVMTTPALAIDGVVKVAGTVPTEAALVSLLTTAAAGGS
jgi:small redox-active disulfide protein 2